MNIAITEDHDYVVCGACNNKFVPPDGVLDMVQVKPDDGPNLRVPVCPRCRQRLSSEGIINRPQ